MYILGLCNDETSSACLMKDGNIIAAVSEERFTRVKMDNSFPSQSIQYCLDFGGITLDQIDAIAYAWQKGFSQTLLGDYVNRAIELGSDKEALEIFLSRIQWEINQDQIKRSEFDNWIKENVDLRSTQVLDFYHHQAHAASAAFFSPFNSGIVFTADGRGDFESTTIWQFDRFSKNSLNKLYSGLTADSLGYFYGRITGLLGFKPMRHEGKITGLAAYGDPSEAMELCKKMINVSDGKLVSSLGSYYAPFFEPYEKQLINEIKKFSREDMAAATQLHLENMMSELLEYYLVNFSEFSVNLMCAGGVFGNVKVTQRLKNSPRIKSTYVQPQMGDGGLCLGAAALANEELNNSKNIKTQPTKPLTSVYLGPSYDYKNKVFDLSVHLQQCEIEKAPKEFVDSLIANKVIGLVQGRMEFGPRALCNRSIIYRTSDSTINDWLNKRMQRTEFMPFAPVIRLERTRDVVLNHQDNDITLEFMTSTVNVTKEFRDLCPAVVHVDNTARPQVVTSTSNEFIWNVLKIWEEVSGELSLVNTSFNVHEEPIIQSEFDGINALKDGVVDELWVLKDKEFFVYSLS
jgi:carbamoyltransferase